MEPLYCSAANHRISKTAVLRGFPNLSISFEASLTRQSGNWIFTQGEPSGRLNYNRTRGKLLTLFATDVPLICSPQSGSRLPLIPTSLLRTFLEVYVYACSSFILLNPIIAFLIHVNSFSPSYFNPLSNLVALLGILFTYLLSSSSPCCPTQLIYPHQPLAHLITPFSVLFQNFYAGSYKCNL